MKLSSFESQINGLVYHLKRKGIGKGHKVAFVATPEEAIVCLFFALFRLQAIACPLSPRFPDLSPYLKALGPDFFLTCNDLVFNPAPQVSYQLENNQVATLLFTSGSGAAPKMARHTYGNHVCSAKGVNEALSFGPEHSWHLSLPLYHVSGIAILFRCLLADASLLLPPIPIENATHISLVPTQVFRLEKQLSSTILIGGGPIPSSLFLKGLNLKTSYGLTEMSSTVSIDGAILPFRECRLAADGEILVRGETLFLGYEGQTPLKKEEWFPTRDLGAITEKGLQIIGRKDNLFISGGENIQPEEIEALLLTLPGMEQTVVIPQRDPEFGARPVAFIYAPTQDYTLQTLAPFLERHLPRFKWPIRIMELPEQYVHSKPSRPALFEIIN